MISKVSDACLPQFLRFQSISMVLRKVVNHNGLSSRYVISILIIFLVLFIDASVQFPSSCALRAERKFLAKTDSLRRNIVSSSKLIYAPKNDTLRTKSESNAVRLV